MMNYVLTSNGWSWGVTSITRWSGTPCMQWRWCWTLSDILAFGKQGCLSKFGGSNSLKHRLERDKQRTVAMEQSQYYLTPSIEATYVNVPKQNSDSRRSSWTYGQESIDGDQMDGKVTLKRVSATNHLNLAHNTRRTLQQSDRRKLLSIAKRLDVGNEELRENLQSTRTHLITALTLVEKNLQNMQNTNDDRKSHASSGWRKFICCFSK